MSVLCDPRFAPYLAGSSPTGGLRPSLPLSVALSGGVLVRVGGTPVSLVPSKTSLTGQHNRPEHFASRIPTSRTWAGGSQPRSWLGAAGTFRIG